MHGYNMENIKCAAPSDKRTMLSHPTIAMSHVSNHFPSKFGTCFQSAMQHLAQPCMRFLIFLIFIFLMIEGQ